MLKPKKGFENTTITFKVGAGSVTLNVSNITEDHIINFRNHIDLSYFVEKHEPKVITKYVPELHDAETVIQSILNDPTEEILDLQEPVKKPRKRRKK